MGDRARVFRGNSKKIKFILRATNYKERTENYGKLGTYGTYCVKEKNVKIINESNIVIITFLITFTKNQHSTVSFEMKLRIFHIFHFIIF